MGHILAAQGTVLGITQIIHSGDKDEEGEKAHRCSLYELKAPFFPLKRQQMKPLTVLTEKC